jgi:hypothetical protein
VKLLPNAVNPKPKLFLVAPFGISVPPGGAMRARPIFPARLPPSGKSLGYGYPMKTSQPARPDAPSLRKPECTVFLDLSASIHALLRLKAKSLPSFPFVAHCICAMKNLCYVFAVSRMGQYKPRPAGRILPPAAVNPQPLTTFFKKSSLVTFGHLWSGLKPAARALTTKLHYFCLISASSLRCLPRIFPKRYGNGKVLVKFYGLLPLFARFCDSSQLRSHLLKLPVFRGEKSKFGCLWSPLVALGCLQPIQYLPKYLFRCRLVPFSAI